MCSAEWEAQYVILHQPRHRPEPFETQREKLRFRWAVPFLAIEWIWEWVAYLLSRWSFLEVLEYLGSFSVLIAVIFYYHEAPDRLKQKHYQAWQVINTAQGKGGSGGRLEALQELNEDKVSLVGVDASGAFLQGINLNHSRLTRANFSDADIREGSFEQAELDWASLHSANLRGSTLARASLENADLRDADLVGANLRNANLEGADLSGADLRDADFAGANWRGIKGLKAANLAGVKNAPAGFVEWALQRGAIENKDAE